VAHQASSPRSAPRWFWLVRFWTAAPVLVALVGLGYAVGHALAAAIAAVVFLFVGVIFGHWARGNRARVRERLRADPSYRKRHDDRSDRLGTFFGRYFAVLGALLALLGVVWVIARLA
jgi:hypothetical protein